MVEFFASMGPRSADRGNNIKTLPFDDCFELQWGRDQLIAEMRLLVGVSRGTIRLQWGRDQLIAEMRQVKHDTKAVGQLQWGRDQLIAEIWVFGAKRGVVY